MSGASDVWVGLVEVRALPGNDVLEGDPGAFANVLSVAGDADDFRTRAEAFFRGERFEVISFERVERLDARAGASPLPTELRELAELARSASEVQFDTYYRYGSPDE